MATLKDIAKRAGLSVTQVSRALNNHSDVNEATRAHIQGIAREMNYHPNLSARKLVSGRSGMVGMVVSQSSGMIDSGGFLEEISGLSMCFSERQMHFLLHVARPDEPIVPVYQRLVGTGALDGFVLIHPRTVDERATFLTQAGVPFVVHGRIGESPDHPFYDIDNEGIFFSLTQHLLDLGHRRIALLNGVEGRSFVAARTQGHERALAQAGVTEPPLILYDEMTEDVGRAAAVSLMRGRSAPPTALICGNTRLARGVLQGLAELGLSVPGDVSVVAHDDFLAGVPSDEFVPPLTVSEASLSNSWPRLAANLAAALDGAPLVATQEVGPWQFQLRSSTAKPRK